MWVHTEWKYKLTHPCAWSPLVCPVSTGTKGSLIGISQKATLLVLACAYQILVAAGYKKQPLFYVTYKTKVPHLYIILALLLPPHTSVYCNHVFCEYGC